VVAYKTRVRAIATRSVGGLARTRITPDALTVTGISMCVAAAVAVYFEYRNELLWFWVGASLFWAGSLLDILDGALARQAGKGTPFGAFFDSTTDRMGEAAMLTAIGVVFMRDDNELALAATFTALTGSFLVSYTRARAEAMSLKGDVGLGSRAERVVVIVSGLFLAPWGLLQWAVYLLNVTAWITVVQRVVYVRRQLKQY
jgi:CDP-diacylglycerol--glycerol-3-phosphate 3-phosphatidyltransferase